MIESSSYRVLVLEPSAKVRRDYQAMLTPSLAEGSGVGSDALEALVAGVMAPPPGFPAVDLTLCRKPAEALRSLEKEIGNEVALYGLLCGTVYVDYSAAGFRSEPKDAPATGLECIVSGPRLEEVQALLADLVEKEG